MDVNQLYRWTYSIIAEFSWIKFPFFNDHLFHRIFCPHFYACSRDHRTVFLNKWAPKACCNTRVKLWMLSAIEVLHWTCPQPCWTTGSIISFPKGFEMGKPKKYTLRAKSPFIFFLSFRGELKGDSASRVHKVILLVLPCNMTAVTWQCKPAIIFLIIICTLVSFLALVRFNLSLPSVGLSVPNCWPFLAATKHNGGRNTWGCSGCCSHYCV